MTEEMDRAIGAGLRRLRVELGISQDELARRARAYGLNWTPSRVSDVERGERSLDLASLVAVTAALNTAKVTGTFSVRDVTGSNLLPVTSAWSIEMGDLIRVLQGDLGELEAGSILPDRERQKWDEAFDPERIATTWSQMPPGTTARIAAEIEARASTLAETRAAKRIGVPVLTLKVWAHHLWGTSLDDRAARIAAGPSAQARGHATRALSEEIEEAIRGQAPNTAE